MTVKIDGYVEKLFSSTTGEFVKEGEPLLTIYSPMLVSAQQEYLNVVKDNVGLAAAAKKRRRCNCEFRRRFTGASKRSPTAGR